MNPKVSVIIPTYNFEKLIGETVSSVLAQNYDNIEVIVIDDGSTDHTKEVLNRFGDQIKYIYQNNQGESTARNCGIRQAQGQYLIFLDADDLLAPQTIQKSVDALTANPGYKVVFGQQDTFTVKESKKIRFNTTKAFHSGDQFPQIVRGISLIPGQFLLDRACLEEIGNFAEDLMFGEDWEFLLRLSKNYHFFYIPEIFAHKREHAAMQTFSKNRPDIVELRKGILKNTFGPDAELIERRFLNRRIYADWYCAAGFTYLTGGNTLKAKEYVQKSLKTWPWQPSLYLWLIYHSLPDGVRKLLRLLKREHRD